MSNCGVRKTKGNTQVCGARGGSNGPIAWFDNIVGHCLTYAREKKAAGHPVVGIMCEYTPRELILAAGGVPACLCGGSAATIPAAEEHLPTNLCPLIKSTYGYHVQRSNPFLEMADLVVAETTCDGKKKMFELMAEQRDLCVLELPQRADEQENLERWMSELRRLTDVIESRFNARITPEKLRDAVRVMNRERRLRRELADLMISDTPPLTGCGLLGFNSIIAAMPALHEQLEAAIALLRTAPPAKCGEGPVRVLLTGVPTVHGAERVVEILEHSGGLVVCTDNCTGVKPHLDDIDEDSPDLREAIARKYYSLPCAVMSPNDARLERIAQLAKRYRAECVIDLIWTACLTYDVESIRVRRMSESALGLPFLRIETDYAPCDSQRITTRVQALYETVLERRRS